MRVVLYVFTFFMIMVLHTAKVGARTPSRGDSNHRQNTKKDNPNHKFHKLCLQAHNEYRAIHGAAPLKTNSTLYILARSWAKRLADLDGTSHVTHRPVRGFGENIYWMPGSQMPYEQYAQKAVEAWYDEEKDYDYSRGVYSPETAHFTQLVWVSTMEVGCGYNVSKTNTIFVVCNYAPQGNIQGQYKENVLPPSRYIRS
uniref:Putative antigen 5/scp domain-containing protein n=2 Tax=Ixodes ricinus TaxID=34613 RepID=A0A090XDU3_IXORI